MRVSPIRKRRSKHQPMGPFVDWLTSSWNPPLWEHPHSKSEVCRYRWWDYSHSETTSQTHQDILYPTNHAEDRNSVFRRGTFQKPMINASQARPKQKPILFWLYLLHCVTTNKSNTRYPTISVVTSLESNTRYPTSPASPPKSEDMSTGKHLPETHTPSKVPASVKRRPRGWGKARQGSERMLLSWTPSPFLLSATPRQPSRRHRHPPSARRTRRTPGSPARAREQPSGDRGMQNTQEGDGITSPPRCSKRGLQTSGRGVIHQRTQSISSLSLSSLIHAIRKEILSLKVEACSPETERNGNQTAWSGQTKNHIVTPDSRTLSRQLMHRDSPFTTTNVTHLHILRK